VNETDIKDLLASAVAHPGPDRIDTDAILRGGHRRQRTRTAATFVSVLAVLALVGSVAFAGRPHPQPNPVVVADSSTLTVACSPTGISVSGDAVAATSAGVVVSLSSTMPKGAYLNFLWSGGGGGDPLPAAPATWTLQVPPGPLTLSCTLNGDPTPNAERAVTVTDPHAFWRATTLTDLGCGMGGMLDWGGTPGSGATPEAAVDDLLPTFSPGRTLTASQAAIGYPDAATQTWIASTTDGQPYLAVSVAPHGSAFTAAPDAFCAP